MRKITITIVLLFFLCLEGFSQTSFGIKGALNLSKAIYQNKYNEELIKPIRKLKAGLVVGVVLHQELNKLMAVQTELLYSQKGLKTVQEPFHKTTNSMNYIEIPLTGHFSIIHNRYYNLNLYIGVYSAYWTDGRSKRKDLKTSETTIIKVDFKNKDYEYSRIDAGVLAGMLYKKKTSAYFIRYTHSMLGSSKINTTSLSNKVITIGFSYFIL